MYNTSDSKRIEIQDSFKNIILICLALLVFFSVISGYFIPFYVTTDSVDLGHLIFSLFVVCEIPILINYTFFVFSRFVSISDTLYLFFYKYYTLGLILHCLIFTILLGFLVAHFSEVNQGSFYCLLLMFIFGLLWVIEYCFWFNKWPLYPKKDSSMIYFYWLQWFTLFGLLIGLPFHARIWNLFWICIFSPLSLGSLLLVIILDIRNKVITSQEPVKLKK